MWYCTFLQVAKLGRCFRLLGVVQWVKTLLESTEENSLRVQWPAWLSTFPIASHIVDLQEITEAHNQKAFENWETEAPLESRPCTYVALTPSWITLLAYLQCRGLYINCRGPSTKHCLHTVPIYESQTGTYLLLVFIVAKLNWNRSICWSLIDWLIK